MLEFLLFQNQMIEETDQALSLLDGYKCVHVLESLIIAYKNKWLCVDQKQS